MIGLWKILVLFGMSNEENLKNVFNCFLNRNNESEKTISMSTNLLKLTICILDLR